jgi:tRNA A-37 threonylcarbamoyl transferase component Bud32
MTLRWLHGEAELRSTLESHLATDAVATEVLAESERRRIVQLRRPGGEAWILKRFHRPTRRRAARWVASAAGASPAEREWRALVELHAAKLPVPEPLGLARLSHGEWLLVLARIEGLPLAQHLGEPEADPTATLAALGSCVAQLHAAGFSHGDLHVGNVLVNAAGPALLDLQAARSGASRRAQLRDIASLDFSLGHLGIAASTRSAMCEAALEGSASNAIRQRELREVAHASRRHGRRYYRSRTRRCLRAGRLYASVTRGSLHGMRCVDFSEDAVFAALDAHREAVSRGGPAVLKWDHRGRASAVRVAETSVVVKEVTKGGIAKQLADAFRGSPARRAWVGAHGLRARGIGAARALAFVERRTPRGPTASIVVLEDVRPARPAGAFLSQGPASDRQEALDALCTLAIRLHQGCVDHGDLQAHHVFLEREAGGMSTRLIDLEGVRFPRRLRDGQRIDALAELNASLHDDLVTASERRKAFRRYAAALPFAMATERALERIITASRKRAHLWTGRDCGERERISPVEP